MPNLDRSQSDRWFWLLFIGLTIVNAFAIAFSPLTLAPDEAHYWDWSRQLDWSYYSKGPLVAVLIAGSRLVFGDTEFAVRFPALACYTVFSLVYYLFVRRFFLPSVALLSWLALRSMLIFAQMGLVMTTDAPAALFWLLALVAAYLAVVEERRGFWVAFGAAAGIGVSAKYTVGILVPSIVLLLVLTPQLRNHLKTAAFYLGLATFMLALYPIVRWNSEHGWVNFAHNAGHLVKQNGATLSFSYLPELILGQAGLAGPVVFVGLIFGLARGWQMWRRGDIPAGLFFFSSAPLALLCCLIALTKRVYANWPLPLYIGALMLVTHLLSQRKYGAVRTRKAIFWGLILNAAIVVVAHIPFLGFSLGLPGKILPTKKLVGWDILGETVAHRLSAELGANRELPFVLSDDYEILSAVAFYSIPRPQTFCANIGGRRMNQYDIWDGLEEQKGKNALVVVTAPEKAEAMRSHFASLTPLEPRSLPIEYSGTKVRELFLYLGENYDGVPGELPTKR